MSNRIPQSFIQDLIARTDIIELISERLALTKRGQNYQALCPFHQEKTPSFSVNAEKQFYYCFGCAAHGNVINFLMTYDHMEFLDAIKYLAAHANLPLPTNTDSVTQVDKMLYQAMHQACRFFQNHLAKSDVAISYLKSRGLTGETAKQFCLGFAPPNWRQLAHFFAKDPKLQSSLITNGLLIKKEHSLYDRFRNRIMFPIRDLRGRVIAFGGRTIDDTDQPKYLNSPETPIFHKSNELYGLFEARQANHTLQQILIVEGYMDVIALAQHGINYAVATLGTATNRKHVQKLLRYTSKLIFCFDGDKAGQQAAWKALLITLPLLHDGIHIHFLFLTDGEDPDERINKVGKEQFEHQIEQCASLEMVFFNQLQKKYSIETMDGKAAFSKAACQHIATMPNGIYQQLMQERIASILNLSVEKLPELSQYVTKNGTNKKQTVQNMTESSPYQVSKQLTPAQLAIVLLLRQPTLANQVDDFELLQQINSLDRQLFLALVTFYQQNPDATVGYLLSNWHNQEQKRIIAELSAREIPISKNEIKHEFLNLLYRLKTKSWEYMAQQLIDKAKQKPLTESEKKLLAELLKKKADNKLAHEKIKS